MFYALTGPKKEWFNKRINLFVALSPAIHVANAGSGILNNINSAVGSGPETVSNFEKLGIYSLTNDNIRDYIKFYCVMSPTLGRLMADRLL